MSKNTNTGEVNFCILLYKNSYWYPINFIEKTIKKIGRKYYISDNINIRKNIQEDTK